MDACSIAQEGPDLPRAVFDSTYRSTKTPVVIRNATLLSAAAFRAMTTIPALIGAFGDANVTLSSANAFSYGRRTQQLREYLDSALGPHAQQLWERAADDDDAASDIFYWFGEHGSELQQLISSYPLPEYTYPVRRRRATKKLRMVQPGFFSNWASGASATDDDEEEDDEGGGLYPRQPALSFGVGPDGSGVPFHFHNDGFSEVMHGAKYWLLYPHKPPRFRENATSVSWLKHDYPRLAPHERPRDCTIHPGDLLYFPRDWWHAIVNRGDPTVFMSTFL